MDVAGDMDGGVEANGETGPLEASVRCLSGTGVLLRGVFIDCHEQTWEVTNTVLINHRGQFLRYVHPIDHHITSHLLFPSEAPIGAVAECGFELCTTVDIQTHALPPDLHVHRASHCAAPAA